MSSVQESNTSAWVPENPGDKITGTVVKVERVEFERDGATQRPLVVTVDEHINGEATGEHRPIWAWHSVLHGECGKARPKIGETVTIVYKGRRQGGKYKYADYSVTVEGRAPAEFSWDDDVGPELPREPPAPAEDTDDDEEIPF
jgi:hypothetical protein